MKNEITDLFHPVLRDPGVARPAALGEGGVLEGEGAGVLEEVIKPPATVSPTAGTHAV
jgi:hypothetical protein